MNKARLLPIFFEETNEREIGEPSATGRRTAAAHE